LAPVGAADRQVQEGVTESDVLFAILIEARRSPQAFNAVTVRDILVSYGFQEVWEDAQNYLEIEAATELEIRRSRLHGRRP
jgi:hypothetical protein